MVFDNEQSSLTLLAFKAGVKRGVHCDEKDEVALVKNILFRGWNVKRFFCCIYKH